MDTSLLDILIGCVALCYIIIGMLDFTSPSILSFTFQQISMQNIKNKSRYESRSILKSTEEKGITILIICYGLILCTIPACCSTF